MIRLTIPDIDDEDLLGVREVLLGGMLVQGPQVKSFEDDVAEYVGAGHAVAVSNCTTALHLSLMALGVRSGDTVAVSAYSWPATANVVELVGATPRFVDIDPKTYNLDPAALERVLSEPIAAIIAVHAFGNPADMSQILRQASSVNVPVIEDAACSLGSTLEGRHTGTWGTIGCFSFHPRKAVTTGEGGVIVTDDGTIADACRALRNHGQDPNAEKADFVVAGFNSRMTDMQGALGRSQMKKIERHVHERRERAALYDALLQDSEIQVPVAMEVARHNYQSYVILLPQHAAPRRSEVISGLRDRGIETTIGTYNIAATSFFATKYGYSRSELPVTDEVAARALTLPLHEQLLPQEQERVVGSLFEILA